VVESAPAGGAGDSAPGQLQDETEQVRFRRLPPQQPKAGKALLVPVTVTFDRSAA